MSHRYYIDDQENDTRMNYFDNWFKILSKEKAKLNGVTISSYFSQIKDQDSFEAVLQESFSLDGSLANYVAGFDYESFRLFFNRPIIQEIVQANSEEDEEFFKEIQKEIPVSVEQVVGQTEEFFKGTFVDKETGKEKKVIAKLDSVKVRGKDMVRYRDAKGRFVKKV